MTEVGTTQTRLGFCPCYNERGKILHKWLLHATCRITIPQHTEMDVLQKDTENKEQSINKSRKVRGIIPSYKKLNDAPRSHQNSKEQVVSPIIPAAMPSNNVDTESLDLQAKVELYGRCEAAVSWIFTGCAPDLWATDKIESLTIVFERGVVLCESKISFYVRHDLPKGSIGFVAVLFTPQGRLGRVHHLEFTGKTLDGKREFISAQNASEISEAAIVSFTSDQIMNYKLGPGGEILNELLSRHLVGEGFLDSYGYHVASKGWFISGWVSNEWTALHKRPEKAVAYFEHGQCHNIPVLNYFEREDIRGIGVGIIVHISTPKNNIGHLLMLSLHTGQSVLIAKPPGAVEKMSNDIVAAHYRNLIINSDPSLERDLLRDLAWLTAYDGVDTILQLTDRILVNVEELILCPPDSILLLGWLLSKPGIIKSIKLESSNQSFPVDMSSMSVWFERSDVSDSIGHENGFDSSCCGFIVRVPTGEIHSRDFYLNITTVRGETGFKSTPRPRLDGLPAIKHLLAKVDGRLVNTNKVYDQIFGPSIEALNSRRLESKPNVERAWFGPTPKSPKFSVIIPVYDRIDYMELQQAIFAVRGISSNVELIYVLDDPSKAGEVRLLAYSLYERFQVSFSLLFLSQNVGFAQASNVGLRVSSGQFICFMNSDVFPTTGDWLDLLVLHLERDPTLGAVGPTLLFEDRSVQHQGISFHVDPQLPHWAFARHDRKGLRIQAESGLVREHAITGACMLLRREEILQLGGFDEAYIIGDFEDTDLCLRLRNVHLQVGVDRDLFLYHLERKSQAESSNLWRRNLTLYNAWVHQGRWTKFIDLLR